MDFMKKAYGIQLLGLGISLALMGCLDSTDSQHSLPEESKPGSGTEVVFTNSFSDGGSFQVVQDGNSQLGYSVMAPLGSEAEKLLLKSEQAKTLADVFTVLHAGKTEIPPELQKLSETKAKQDAEGLSKAAASRVDTVIPIPPIIVSDGSPFANSFMNDYCVDKITNHYYHPVECRANQNIHHLITNYIVSAYDDGLFFKADKIYAKNGSQWDAILIHSKAVWRPIVHPNSVLSAVWPGTYFEAKVSINVPTSKRGPLGITVHRPDIY
jgi:hypothetical protein